MTTDPVLPELAGTLASLPEHTQATIRAYGAACARTALQSQDREDGDHDLRLAWHYVALGLATDYAEAYCNMQCDDSEDNLHEMLRTRRELQQHLYSRARRIEGEEE